MKLARHWVRRWSRRLCGGLVAALLFMQLAVAAYACPSLAPAAMPDCHAAALDDEAPQLCRAHCGIEQQQQAAPTLPALDAAPLLWLAYLLPALPPVSAEGSAAPDERPPGADAIPIYLRLRVLRH